ncbi:MAG: NAD-dependent protein deacylase [Spirochaetales bacterium]|nr:NAD-dependent protein deacylase [Spirochaetales bacterium]
MEEAYIKAAELLGRASRVVAFTGAGVSVESGIPPFRGPGGLWSRYDPVVLDIDYFRRQPRAAWIVIKEIFYDFFGAAKPNDAHLILADWERRGFLASIITQNIDNLHQEAGSRVVHEYHGTASFLVCDYCRSRFPVASVSLENLPPRCPSCAGVLRPDFVFFGEPIPEAAARAAEREAREADVFLIVGTTGEIMPASMIPRLAKSRGAAIVEINPAPSSYTDDITDVFLRDPATVAVRRLEDIQGRSGHSRRAR